LRFYVGLHIVSHAVHFGRCMISVNRLRKRKSEFSVKEWILDSGAFSQIYRGGCHMPAEEYAEQINRWRKCGNLVAAVTQDFMCEPFILARTGATVEQHQAWTVERYVNLLDLVGSDVYIMPVLQGYKPEDYVRHIIAYGRLLRHGAWVGVGSVCKRNSSPAEVYEILRTIKETRPDLRLHGFGLKITVFKFPEITKMLYSADSMAWSYAGRRRDGKSANDWVKAKEFVEKVAQVTSYPMPSLFDLDFGENQTILRKEMA